MADRFYPSADWWSQVGDSVFNTSLKVDSIDDNLANHKNTDLSRWQDYADLKSQFFDLKSSIANKVLDNSQAVDIESDAQSSGYQVIALLGGRVQFTATIVLLTLIPQWIKVNNTTVWSGSGLGLGSITDSAEVQIGDVVTCSGMTYITFTPYVEG